MQLKNVFCQIDSDDGNFFHGCLPLLTCCITTNLAHCDAIGEGWHPPHLLGVGIVSIGPLIAGCCQAAFFLTSGTPVAIAPSELVGLRRRSDRGWQDDRPARLDNRYRWWLRRNWIDVVAGVMVLSEVASAS